MSQQKETETQQPDSPKDRESDDLIPDDGQQDDEDRPSVIRPPRPAQIPPGGLPPHLPAPHNAPTPFPAPHEAPALGGESTQDPD